MFRYLLFIILFLASLSSHAQSRTYITGPKGGCYYINKNGNKTYVDRSLCGQQTNGEVRAVVEEKADTVKLQNHVYETTEKKESNSSGTRTYIRGPRGGCYYISKSGSKVYVDRSLCD
jgi:hypothetical protein